MISITRIRGMCRKDEVDTRWFSVLLREGQRDTEIGVMHEDHGEFVPTANGLAPAVVAAAKRACAEQHVDRNVRSEDQRALAAAQMESRPTAPASSVEDDDESDGD